MPGFDHTHEGPDATDYKAAFPNGQLLQVQIPGSSPPNVFPFGKPGQPLGWGDWVFLNSGREGFNAIHMSLIPKGPYRGQVIVWNRYPVTIRPGSPFSPTEWWYCQGWAVINPDPGAPAPHCRNFLLPLGKWTISPEDFVKNELQAIQSNLFCSGHAWSPHGDLVVAGGDTFLFAVNPTLGLVQDLGAKHLLLWDPAAASAVDTIAFPNTALYPGEFGRWRQESAPNHELASNRWYPTVTLTHRLTRTNFVETMVISGGWDPAFAANTNPHSFDPRNTFESFQVRATGLPTPVFVRDIVSSQVLFHGSGISNSPDTDWLDEYPRQTLLSDGTLFFSGYAAPGARVNPETPPLILPPGPGTWDPSVGGAGFAWVNPAFPNNPLERHDGSTVTFTRTGPFFDLVVRLGGAATSLSVPPAPPLSGSTPTTDTVEVCAASQTAPTPGAWTTLAPLPDGPRLHPNALILPDRSILVLGGTDWSNPVSSATFTPFPTKRSSTLYKFSTGWTEPLEMPTSRGYHATAVLLPDGRVFVGGGDERFLGAHGATNPHDYDIFEPPYLHSGQPRPASVTLPDIPLAPDGFHLSNDTTNIRLSCATLPTMTSVARVVLIAPGSVTHHTDMSARYVELETRSPAPDGIKFDIPSEKIVPHGYYMLWAVTNGDIPSEAVWVKIQ